MLNKLREFVQKRCCQHFFCGWRQSGASDETDAFQSQESNRVAELNRNSIPNIATTRCSSGSRSVHEIPSIAHLGSSPIGYAMIGPAKLKIY